MKPHKDQQKATFLGLIALPVLIGIILGFLSFLSPDTIKFPSVLEIYKDFVHSLFDKSVINALISTAKYVLISTVISIVLGTILSFVLSINRKIWHMVEPAIDFLRSIPVTFFIPASTVILGVSSPNIVWILAVLPSSLIILVNVAYGIKQQQKPENQHRLHHYKMLSNKTSKLALFTKVTVYEMVPFFLTGFKVALSYGIVVVTVLEYMQIGSEVGLGRLVYDEMEQLNYKRVYSIIIIVGLIGYVLNYTVQHINHFYRKIKFLLRP